MRKVDFVNSNLFYKDYSLKGSVLKEEMIEYIVKRQYGTVIVFRLCGLEHLHLTLSEAQMREAWDCLLNTCQLKSYYGVSIGQISHNVYLMYTANVTRSKIENLTKLMVNCIYEEANQFGLHLIPQLAIIKYDEEAMTKPDLTDKIETSLLELKKMHNMERVFNYCECYDPRLSIQTIGHAIESNELMLTYAPIYDIQSHRLMGLEAEPQWEIAENEMITAQAFIPLLDLYGQLEKLTMWTIKNAINDMQTAELLQQSSAVLMIQLSINEVATRHFVTKFKDLIAEHPFPNERICLKLTRSYSPCSLQRLNENIKQLKELSIQIMVDEMRVLQYLEDEAVDVIKLNPTELTRSLNHMTYYEKAVELMQVAQIKVLTEAVSSKEEYGRYRALGCQLAKGAYIEALFTSSSASLF